MPTVSLGSVGIGVNIIILLLQNVVLPLSSCLCDDTSSHIRKRILLSLLV